MCTNTELVELDKVVQKNGNRFEHARVIQGLSHRDLESRVARLEAHVGINC